MAANLRFSTAMEALVLMATEPARYRTSQALALALATNPVVVRRLLASLSRAGLVASTKGPGGGTRLTRPAKQISLRAVYRALGPTELLHRPVKHESGGEKEVRKAVHAALRKAEKSFEQELDAITLNQVIKRAGLKAAKPGPPDGEKKPSGDSVPPLPPPPAASS